jgi:hypothetical protein
MEEIKTKSQVDSVCSESYVSGIKMLPVEDMKKWYEGMVVFGKEILKLNIDYGIVAGIDKPALLKPGAEKIKKAFELQVEEMNCVKEIFDVDNNYIDYTYKCIITTKNGLRLGICDGNSNSKEDKFRYIYKPSAKVPNKSELEMLKLEGKGKWKKCFDKWIWLERIENPDIISLKNSIQKIAQKRAFVGAVLMAAGASEFFTQDFISN